MKSFKKFLNERRSEDIEKLRNGEIKSSEYDDIEDYKREKSEIESARKRFENKPVLSDDEMRQQNPKATAAYEDDVKKRKKVDPKKVSVTQTGTGEWEITNKPETPSSTSRTSTRNKPKTSRNITKPSGRLTSSAPKLGSAASKVTSSNKTQTWQGPIKPPKPAVSSTQSVASTLKDVLKTQRDAKAAQRAAFATGAKKTLGNVGKAAGIIGAGLEAKTGYETARAQGASKKTAAATGGLKAAGALAGGAIGGALGSVLGVPGAIGGSVAGYTLGTKAGEAAAKALRGDYAKKFTTKDLQTNVRKAVPYSVRSQIPGQVRKGFSDFITQAGKTYGNWSKSQSKGGNK